MVSPPRNSHHSSHRNIHHILDPEEGEHFVEVKLVAAEKKVELELVAEQSLENSRYSDSRDYSVRLEVPVLGPRTTKYSTITSRSLYYA